MATDLSYTVRAGLSWSYAKENDFGDTSNAGGFTFSDAITNGTVVDTADLLYLAAPTIAASGTLNIDLASASTLTPFGDAITFARVKTVMIQFDNVNGNTATSIVVGNGTNPFVGWFGAGTHTEAVFKDGVFLKHNPTATAWAVTASTADILKITNADASNAAKLLIAIAGSSV